jgi:cobalamin biosynthesis Mg chelatase CobN
MNRIFWPLAFAMTLIAGVVLAQSPTAPSGSTAQGSVQQQTGNDAPAASTAPASPSSDVTQQSQGTSSSSGTTDPASSTSGTTAGSTSMPKTASALPMLGIVGVTLLTAAVALSIRKRES